LSVHDRDYRWGIFSATVMTGSGWRGFGADRRNSIEGYRARGWVRACGRRHPWLERV